MSGFWLRLLAAFLVGSLLGAAVVNALSGKRLESLYLEAEKLRVELSEQQEKLSKLTEKISYRPVVEDFEVHVKGPSPREEVEVEKQVRAMLHELIGKPVAQIDPWLIFSTLEGRIIELGKERFRLRARAALFDRQVVIYLEVEREPGH